MPLPQRIQSAVDTYNNQLGVFEYKHPAIQRLEEMNLTGQRREDMIAILMCFADELTYYDGDVPVDTVIHWQGSEHAWVYVAKAVFRELSEAFEVRESLLTGEQDITISSSDLKGLEALTSACVQQAHTFGPKAMEPILNIFQQVKKYAIYDEANHPIIPNTLLLYRVGLLSVENVGLLVEGVYHNDEIKTFEFCDALEELEALGVFHMSPSLSQQMLELVVKQQHPKQLVSLMEKLHAIKFETYKLPELCTLLRAASVEKDQGSNTNDTLVITVESVEEKSQLKELLTGVDRVAVTTSQPEQTISLTNQTGLLFSGTMKGDGATSEESKQGTPEQQDGDGAVQSVSVGLKK